MDKSVEFFFDNPGNSDIPENIWLAPKYTSTEGISENRIFHFILIDSDQRDSNMGLYWGQSSLKTSVEFSHAIHKAFFHDVMYYILNWS